MANETNMAQALAQGAGQTDWIGSFKEIVFSQAGLGAIFFLAVLVCVGIAFVVWKIKQGELLAKYPVKVRVWERRGKWPVLTPIKEFARAVVTPELAWIYEFKVSKITTNAFKFDYINPDNTLDVLKLSRNEYQPLRLFSETAKLKREDGSEEKIELPKLEPVVSEEFMFAYTARIKKNYERRPQNDFWAKWGGIVTILTVTICAFLLLALVLNEMNGITKTAMETVKIATDSAAKVCSASGASAPPVVTPGMPGDRG